MRGARARLAFAAALAIYAALLVLRRRLDLDGLPAAIRALVIVAPAIPVWAVFVITTLHYRDLDEFQQKRFLEAVSLSFGLTAAAILSYIFFEDLGLPKLDLTAGWPIMAGLWIGLTLFFRWRDRPPHHEE